jgi:hypothetical protein
MIINVIVYVVIKKSFDAMFVPDLLFFECVYCNRLGLRERA